MKKCFKCHETLPLTEFYKHPQMGDGHLGKCKTCTKRDVKATYRIAMQDPARVAKERSRSREKYRRLYRSGQVRVAPPGSPQQKKKAAYTASNAIRDGRLIREPCEECGAVKVDAHHDDYTKPLTVRWLCHKHHIQLHFAHEDTIT